MESILQALFTWQFIFFCLMVFGITFVIRKIAEYFLANNKFIAKESKLWNDLILPILPVFVGLIFALIAKKYPYSVPLTSASARAGWGVASGLLSGLVYRVLNSFLVSFVRNKLPGTVIKDPNFVSDPVVDLAKTIPEPKPASRVDLVQTATNQEANPQENK